MNPEVFFLHIQGEQRGPYTIPQIDHLLNSGLIQEDAMFWREGLEQWQPVTNLVAKRKPVKRWIKPAIAAGILVVLAIPAQLFLPVIKDGWKESSQTAYTESAAYWRSRDFIRRRAVPKGDIIEFAPFKNCRAELTPPDKATAWVKGTIIDSKGRSQPGEWEVELEFDARSKGWIGHSLKELSPQ